MKTGRLIVHSAAMLGRYRLRTGFIMLASLVGVMALTLVLSVGRGAQRKMLTTVRQIFGDSSIVIMAGGHQLMGGPRSDAARLTMDDIEAVANAVPEIELWDPQQVLTASVRHGSAAAAARVLGQSERSEKVWGRTVSEGTYFDAGAVSRMDRVALIGATVVRNVFGGRNPVGSEIMIESVPFTVIGVLEPFGTDLHGMDRDNEVVVPISTLLRRLANLDTISVAKLLVRNPARVTETAAEVRRLLRERHALTREQPDDFGLLTPVEVQQMVGRVRRILAVYLPLASIVVMLVGGMITAALMMAAVNARQGEIGLRRALGAQPSHIGLQFLAETTVTTLGGGVVGIALGLAGGAAVSLHLHLGPVFSWTAVSAGLLISAAAGLMAGVLPARRAARLMPADALR